MTKISWKMSKGNIKLLDDLLVDELKEGLNYMICPSCGLEMHIHNTQRNIFVSCCYCDLSGIGGKIIDT